VEGVSFPRLISGLPEGVTPTKISVGGNHTCAMYAQSIHCWGSNRWGQVSPAASETDVAVTTPKEVNLTTPLTTNNFTLVDMSAGESHTCVLIRVATTNEVQAVCFGSNLDRQCADVRSRTSLPSSILFDSEFKRIYSGTRNSAAVRAGQVNTPFVWGDSTSSKLWSQTPQNIDMFPPSEIKLEDAARSILHIAMARTTTCTLSIDQDDSRRVVRCVGKNVSLEQTELPWGHEN